MISVKNAYVTFAKGTPLESLALRGVTFNAPTGQFVTVIGSNGAGKSTLLNLLSGEAFPDIGKGRVELDDLDVTKWSATHRASAGLVARVFQDPLAGTCEQLTVEENLALAQDRGRRRTLRFALNSQLRAALRERLSRLGLGLENRLGDRIGLLSGGQRQVVSLVMATLQPSRLLLLDEHTAALDPRTAEFVLDLTREVVGEGHLTTMMVTHSMRQAIDFGDRLLMLHQGRVILDLSGTDKQSLTVPALLQKFENACADDDPSAVDDALLLTS